MALSATKYNCFSPDLHLAKHNWVGTGGSGGVHLLFMALTNAAPNAATHTVLGDVTQIANGNGYTTGGQSLQNTCTAAAGTTTLVAQDVTWTSNGSMAGFRYAPIYNDTSATDPLIVWYDLGSTLTMTGNGDTWKADFGASLYSHA